MDEIREARRRDAQATNYEADHVWKYYLKYYCKSVPSQLAIDVARLLDTWVGLNHVEPATMKKVDWTCEYFIKLNMCYTRLSTWDFNDLTRLVFLAHDRCIRVEITSCNMRYLSIMFHPRQREGRFSEKHPTLEQAVAQWREKFPAPAPEPKD